MLSDGYGIGFYLNYSEFPEGWDWKHSDGYGISREGCDL